MKRLALLSLLGAAPVASLFAQSTNDAVINRVQQPATPPSPVAPATSGADKETGDLDGGVQRLAETRTRPFKLTLGYDLQAFYTSNVFLSADKAVESVVVVNTLQTRADFNSITIGDKLLTPSATFVYQHYNHALGTGDERRENLDFDSYAIPLNLRLRFGKGWEANAGLTGNAVYTIKGPPRYNLTYKSVVPGASLRKTVALDRKHILSFGASVSYSITDEDVPFGLYRDDRNDKTDYSLDAAYYYVNGPWIVGPYARLTYADYSHYQEAFGNVDREDLVGTIGFSAAYTVNRWATARAFTSYDWRNPQGSSLVDYGYRAANLGLGLSLTASW